VSIKKSIARIPLGRWLPLAGGVVFFVVMVGAALWIALYVVKPMASVPATVADGSSGPAAVTPGQLTPSASDEPGDAAPASDAPPPGWILIKAGSFTMGSPPDEAGREDDEVEHPVKLTRDVLMMDAEVTQEQFEGLMGYNPSYFEKCGPTCPVEQVTWHEAAAYCNRLSEAAVKVRCYECEGSGTDVTCNPSSAYATPYECPGYRLPTEAEWEYAARAADTRATYTGDIDSDHLKCTVPNPVIEPIGWFCGNSAADYEGAFDCSRWGGASQCGIQPVKQKQPNGLGLYDMLGNVWEWCHDRYGEYPTAETVDPVGSKSGRDRVLRGGAWGDDAKNLRAALRNWNKAGYRFRQDGFRVVVPIESTP
jgi:formylglycine-generating enzyme required for sulfatase activity